MRRQRGVALLAVSLLLVVLGALAFMMARQGAMSGNAVNAQYDTEAARYLAEAGVNVARWRDQQLGCGKAALVLKPGRLDASGTYSATVVDRYKTLDIDAAGATDAGARVAMGRKNLVAHSNVALQLDIASDKMADTFISADAPTASRGSTQFLELTQGRSSALMQFTLPSELAQAIIVKADLALTQYQSNSVLPAQLVSAHRLTRGWDARFASWLWWAILQPWSSPGADYTAAGAGAATTINGNASYSWDITALVDGWANNDFPNYGLLLLADGPLQQARFYSRDSAQNKPALHITYYPAC